MLGLGFEWSPFGRYFGAEDEEHRKQVDDFIGPQSAHWTERVEKSDRVATHTTAAPLKESGVYLVEARVPGSEQTTQGLVVVTGIAIVQKPLVDRIVLWIVDPRSGKALAK